MNIVPSSMYSGVCLVVNGDDFGRSPGINRGIIECHDTGILTSASLMTLWPASAAAADAAAMRPGLSVGLHVDLGEWIYAHGEWKCTYVRVRLEDERAVRAEVERQLRAFRRLLGRDPTHLDSHQHVHRRDPLWTILLEKAEAFGIPLRHGSRLVEYRGDFFGQTSTGESRPEALSVEALIGIVESLPVGFTELGCHPGYARDLLTAYRRQRELEVRTLCDRRVQEALAARGVRLCSFADLAVGDVRLPA